MLRMPDNVIAFAEKTGTSDLFAKFADLWNHYRATNDKKMSDLPYLKVNKEGKPISFEEKSNQLNELLKKEIAKIAGVKDFSIIPAEMWVTNPTYKWATFAVVGTMVDMIIPDTIIDSVGMYTEVKTGGFGDNFTFDIEPNDLFYVTKAGRGTRHAEAQKSFNGQVPVFTTEHDIAVSVNLYRVLAGKENLAAFAMKALRSIETDMAYDVYTAFTTAMAALPTTSGKELQYTGFSVDNIISLTDKVTQYNNGAKAIIVGTRKAVSRVLPTNSNYRYQLDSDYVKLGYVKEFYDTDVLVIPQKADWKNPYSTLLDDTKLYVMSPAAQKIVKLCIEGSTITITDDVHGSATLTQQTTMKKMYGTGVATNATFGVINLSA